MRGETPHPDAGAGGGEPTQQTETIRNTVDEHVFVEWYVDTPTPSFVTVLTEQQGEKHRVVALDTVEVPQAARALRAALEDGPGSALIRDLDPMERVWVESEGGYVTLRTAEVREPAEMLVLEESEARELLSAVELAKQQIGDVEDEPYV